MMNHAASKFVLSFFIAVGVAFSSSAHAAINAADKVYVTTDLQTCWDGKIYTRCPPEPSDAIAGYTSVQNVPLDATGTGIRIDIGGGNNDHADLSTFDPGVLTPGSVVNIFYRATPYTHKLAFWRDGTEDHPIRINGVTDASGNRPVIDCNGATTVQPSVWGSVLPRYGCWTTQYSRALEWSASNNGPEWLVFSNLDMTGASSENDFDGAVSYSVSAAPIRVANGNHIFLRQMIMRNSDNGFFVAANYVNGHIEISGSLFEGNGLVGSYLEHNVYLQAVSPDARYKNIVEGNVFRRLRTGARGLSGVKHRGTDFIFRYNIVECWERCLDIVEAQDELPNWIWSNLSAQEILDRYRTAYVYGNVFYGNIQTGSYSPSGFMHVGMDSETIAVDPQRYPTDAETAPDPSYAGAAQGHPMARGHGSPVYAYHNTILFNSTFARQLVLDLDAGGGGNPSTHRSEAVLGNNIARIIDTTGVLYVGHAWNTGTVTYQGANLLSLPNAETGQIFEGYDVTTQNDPDITINGGAAPTATINYGAGGNPLFVDPLNADFMSVNLRLQAGSPAIGAARPLPAAMMQYPVQLQPRLPGEGGGAELRATTGNLGAYE